jgi:hypothetical protein
MWTHHENFLAENCYFLILLLILGKVTKNNLFVCIHLAMLHDKEKGWAQSAPPGQRGLRHGLF